MENIELQATERWLREQAHCVQLSKLASGAIKPPPPLFDGFLLHQTITMLSAEPFVGKTLLMLAMAISLNTGKPLFGRHTPKELRRVLFIGQDAPTWDYVGQARKLLRGYGVDDLGDLDTDLILNESVNIMDRKFLEWLKTWHDETQFDVLMLDTILAMHSLDENSNPQMKLMMGVLKHIRDSLGVAVIFSHHLTKPSQTDTPVSANYRARGASAIVGGVDFHFSMSAADDGHVNLIFPKGRGADGMEPPPYFSIVAAGDEGSRSVVLEAPNEDTRRVRLITLLKTPHSRKDLSMLLLLAEPSLTKTKADKWVDNELAALKRNGAAETTERGIWVLKR